jgi:hypothetical protein
MTLWDEIATGADRLTRAEDVLLWKWRGEGLSFERIEAEILRRRVKFQAMATAGVKKRADVVRSAWAGRDRANAKRWREQLRQERAGMSAGEMREAGRG